MISEPEIVGFPVVNVTPLVLIKPPPLTVTPFSFANIKSAFWPAISIVPLIFDPLFPVTSVKIAFAALFKFGLWTTIPPILVTTGSFVALLLKITPFPAPTLKSINLLWEIPPEFGLVICITSVPLALSVIEGPPEACGFISFAPLFLVLKSLAITFSSINPIWPVIKKATIKLKVILLLFFKLCFNIFSFLFK